MRTRILLPIAWLVLVLVFVVYVWPTRWRYDHMTVDGNIVPVRMDRFSGDADMAGAGRGLGAGRSALGQPPARPRPRSTEASWPRGVSRSSWHGWKRCAGRSARKRPASAGRGSHACCAPVSRPRRPSRACTSCCSRPVHTLTTGRHLALVTRRAARHWAPFADVPPLA
jgi:hypothetical protein